MVNRIVISARVLSRPQSAAGLLSERSTPLSSCRARSAAGHLAEVEFRTMSPELLPYCSKS